MAGMTVAERLGLDKGHHDLKIGKSFEKSSKDSFHTIRYDFKPASVDTNQESTVVIGDDSSVEVTVPLMQTAGAAHTVYKGNKRPLQKECVLIINHDTGDVVLEKLSYAIQLKRTRSEPSARMAMNPRPLTPIEKTSSKSPPVRKAPVKPRPSTPNSQQSSQKSSTYLTAPSDIFHGMDMGKELGAADMDMSSSSSSASSSDSGSSDSDSDDQASKPKANKFGHTAHSDNRRPDSTSSNPVPPASFLHTLSHDLRLSESSDDDSD